MGRKSKVLVLALTLAVASGASLFAQTYSFGTFVPSSPSGTYDWEGTTQIPVTGYVNYGSSTMRSAFFPFRPARGSRFFSYNGNTIPYTIYKFTSSTVGNELWAWSENPTTDNVFSVTFYGRTTNAPFYFIIIPDAGYLKPAGTYTTTINVDYYTGTFYGTSISNATYRTTKAFSASLVVPAVCDLSIVSSSGSFDVNSTSQALNFGDVTTLTNPSLSAKAIVRSNASSWSIYAKSTNGGSMKTSSLSIPYFFYYNGTQSTGTLFSLTTSDQLLEQGNWEATSDGFAERPMTIMLGDTFVEPGTYSDTITFTVVYN